MKYLGDDFISAFRANLSKFCLDNSGFLKFSAAENQDGFFFLFFRNYINRVAMPIAKLSPASVVKCFEFLFLIKTLFLFVYLLFYFNWRIITLLYCDGFFHIST